MSENRFAYFLRNTNNDTIFFLPKWETTSRRWIIRNRPHIAAWNRKYKFWWNVRKKRSNLLLRQIDSSVFLYCNNILAAFHLEIKNRPYRKISKTFYDRSIIVDSALSFYVFQRKKIERYYVKEIVKILSNICTYSWYHNFLMYLQLKWLFYTVIVFERKWNNT